MAFDYIGTPIQQVAARKKMGDQNFPFTTPGQLLIKTGTESYAKYSDYKENFIDFIGGVDYQTTSTGAKNGFYIDLLGCNSNSGSPYRIGFCTPFFPNAYGLTFFGSFALRLPIVQTVGNKPYVTYHILICICSGSAGFSFDNYIDSRFCILGAGSNGYARYGLSSFGTESFERLGLYARPQYGLHGIVREESITGRLHAIEDAIASDGNFGRVTGVHFTYGNEPGQSGGYLFVSNNNAIYSYPYQMDSLPDAQYNSYMQTQDAIMATNLPIWDISGTDHAGDILAYLRTGVAANTWDGYSGYEPDFDVTVDDTSTHWRVKVCGEPVDNVKIRWSNSELNQMPQASRNMWHACVWVLGYYDSAGVFQHVDTLDIYGYLYDGIYNNRGCVITYDKILEYSGLGGILNPRKNQEIRIGFCLYAGEQTSAVGYVDVDYDSMATPNYGFVDLIDNSTITVTRHKDPDEGFDGDDDDYDDEDFPDDDDDIEPDDGISVTDGGFCRCYKFNKTQLTAVARYFWNDGDDSFISKYINAVNNPVECILSCGYMPVSASGVDNAQVSIGNVAFTGCTGTLIEHSTVRVLIGSLAVPEIYESFLDYQPYTNLTIFLPYIGFKTLPTNLFMGKTLKVYYSFDLVTGACKAELTVVAKDSYGVNYDKYVMSFDGDCMIHIPMTASNNSDVFMQRFRSAVEAATSIAAASIGSVSSSRTIGSVATSTTVKKRKGARGRLATASDTSRVQDTDLSTERHAHNYGSAVSQVVGSGLDIAMAKHTFDSNGGASSAVCSTEPNKVYIIIDSPTVQYPSTYDHNCGKPCELSINLSSLHGYTECDGGIDLSGLSCTEEERAIILRELVSGVYL